MVALLSVRAGRPFLSGVGLLGSSIRFNRTFFFCGNRHIQRQEKRDDREEIRDRIGANGDVEHGETLAHFELLEEMTGMEVTRACPLSPGPLGPPTPGRWPSTTSSPNHPEIRRGCPAGWPRSAGPATAPTRCAWPAASTRPTSPPGKSARSTPPTTSRAESSLKLVETAAKASARPARRPTAATPGSSSPRASRAVRLPPRPS